MELYVFNDQRRLSGVVESFEYLRWTRRYSACGSFTLKAIVSSENAALLGVGNWVWKNDDDEVGIIEQLSLSQAEKETIEASGRFATGLLARRIVWGTETCNGCLSDCIAQLVNNHLISPADESRAIPNITFSSPVVAAVVRTQISYTNLLDAVEELLQAADVGVKTVFDPKTGSLTITLYQGGASHAVFAREYENILNQNYAQSRMDYADTVLVAGEGEGTERETITILGASGIERRELYVDARDLRSADFPGNYDAALLYRGQEKLAEHAMINAFDAEVNVHANLRYKVDYDLGQTVTIHARKWGVTTTARITEITESYDENGLSLDIVFGRGLLTLAQQLKGRGANA
jgi:hypothetical protein